MKKGQKLIKGGYQLLGFPMEYLNVTQGNNVGTHRGTNAMDNAGKDRGIDETIAPCDMHLVDYDVARNGNAVFMQSDKPVLFRDGTVDYATFMFVHDNNIQDIKNWANAGKSWKQGQTFGDEGTAGYATGNHVHLEVAKGKYSHKYNKNQFGVYYLPNNVSADLAFVLDGTSIINRGPFVNWTDSSHVNVPGSKPVQPSNPQTTGQVLNGIPSDFVYEQATFTCTVDAIKIRRAPSLSGQDTGLRYKKNESVYYDGYVRREGYVWISYISMSDHTRRWMAVGELVNGVNQKPYGTFK